MVVMGGLGAVFASPLRRIITRSMAQQVLRDNLLNSRPVSMAGWFFLYYDSHTVLGCGN